MNEVLAKCNIEINGCEVEVLIKNIKSLRIAILPPDAEIRVSAPKGVSATKIKEFITSKWSWIEQARNRVKSKPQNQNKSYQDGEEHLLFGRKYILKVVEGGLNSVAVTDIDEITMSVRKNTTPELKKKLFERFYKEQLTEKLQTLVPMWGEITGLHLNGWKIQKMKTRWGSCHVFKKFVTFNLELAKHSYKEIEYVILHELSHLVVASHSQKFKNQMSKFMPNWKYYQDKLNNKI